jgi:hypothetical protein
MRQVRRFSAAGLLQTTLAPFPVVANGERFAVRSRTCRVFPNPPDGRSDKDIRSEFWCFKIQEPGTEIPPSARDLSAALTPADVAIVPGRAAPPSVFDVGFEDLADE